MNTQRLFPVVVAPRLLDSLDPHVRIIVYLAESLQPGRKPSPEELKPINVLEGLLESWGNLGGFVAMPDDDVSSTIELEYRRETFTRGFRLNVLHRKCESHLEWLVRYDGLSEGWLDVLLNCLEGFHVQIAPIARVVLTSEIADDPGANSNEDVGSGGRAGPPESRPRRWWPFGRS